MQCSKGNIRTNDQSADVALRRVQIHLPQLSEELLEAHLRIIKYADLPRQTNWCQHGVQQTPSRLVHIVLIKAQ